MFKIQTEREKFVRMSRVLIMDMGVDDMGVDDVGVEGIDDMGVDEMGVEGIDKTGMNYNSWVGQMQEMYLAKFLKVSVGVRSTCFSPQLGRSSLRMEERSRSGWRS